MDEIDKLSVKDQEVELLPSLEERPPLGKVIREVVIPKPRDSEEAEKTAQFLVGIEQAWRARAKDDPNLSIHEDKGRLAVVYSRSDGKKELRYLRDLGLTATLYCDETELANLVALGLVKDVPVVGFRVGAAENPLEGK